MTTRTMRNRITIAGAVLGLAIAGSVGGVATATPAEAAGQCVDYQYSIGGDGGCVANIQTLLNALKAGGPQLEVDGQFGEQTRTAVMALQSTFGVEPDGVVGPDTWAQMCTPHMGPGPITWYPYDAARASGCNI
ncbi:MULTISPECIES: peptidoglycan-binding domain-containing protein [Plantibacter]|uniref:peptidoglycan-binding domain-containing protein n=1 Tax=Plantibacter TaxID=190323 RepID=UPI00137583C8|nr:MULTISPECIES: peptidoglycan-binding domain-containing protein [Plantibacter]MBD8517292.1 peptidoglycan-binding protein [Plantibacter sp. CFBP 8804]